MQLFLDRAWHQFLLNDALRVGAFERRPRPAPAKIVRKCDVRPKAAPPLPTELALRREAARQLTSPFASEKFMRACWDLDSATTHEAALAMHWHFVREVSHAFSVHFALMRSRVVRVDLTEQVLHEIRTWHVRREHLRVSAWFHLYTARHWQLLRGTDASEHLMPPKYPESRMFQADFAAASSSAGELGNAFASRVPWAGVQRYCVCKGCGAMRFSKFSNIIYHAKSCTVFDSRGLRRPVAKQRGRAKRALQTDAARPRRRPKTSLDAAAVAESTEHTEMHVNDAFALQLENLDDAPPLERIFWRFACSEPHAAKRAFRCDFLTGTPPWVRLRAKTKQWWSESEQPFADKACGALYVEADEAADAEKALRGRHWLSNWRVQRKPRARKRGPTMSGCDRSLLRMSGLQVAMRQGRYWHRSWVHKPTYKRGRRPGHYTGTRKPRASNLGDDMSHTFPQGPAASSPAAAAAISEPTGALSFALCLVVGCTEPAGKQKYNNKAHTPAQRFIVPRVCTKHLKRLRRAKAAARLHSLWSDEELVFDQRRQRAIAPA